MAAPRFINELTAATSVSAGAAIAIFQDGTTLRCTPAQLITSAASFLQSGTGAIAETVQAALRRIVHTAQYDTVANFNTARAALTGTIGLPRVQIADGTAASPGIAFGGDTDTGMFLGAVGDMQWAVAGASRMTLTQNGTLTVKHDNNSTAFQANPNAGGTGGAEFQIVQRGATGGGLALTRDTSLTGNHGIGWGDTGTNFWDLDLRTGSGDLVLSATQTNVNWRWMTGNFATTRVTWFGDNGEILFAGGVAGDVTEPAVSLANNRFLAFRNAADTSNQGFIWFDSSNDMNIGSGGTTRIQLTSAGRAKFTAGTSLLHIPVYDTASLPAAGAAEDGSIVIENAGAGDQNIVFYSGGGKFRIDGGAAF